MCGHHTTWYSCPDCSTVVSSTLKSIKCSNATNWGDCGSTYSTTDSSHLKGTKRCSPCQKKKDSK